jgi:hypothetical protein
LSTLTDRLALHEPPPVDQAPHLPPPLREAQHVVIPPGKITPIIIGVPEADLTKLQGYVAGQRTKVSIFAMKAVVNLCAAAACGEPPAFVRDVHPMRLLLPAHLVAALIYLRGKRDWSDGTIAAVFAMLQPLMI